VEACVPPEGDEPTDVRALVRASTLGPVRGVGSVSLTSPTDSTSFSASAAVMGSILVNDDLE
jgi:hypothetical protein